MIPRRRIQILVVTWLVAAAMTSLDISDSRFLPSVAPAYADDDDGGGRSRGGRSFSRGDDDGPTLLRPWRKRKARVRRAARAEVVQADYEPRTLIARGLSDAALSALGTRGYRVIERHVLTGGAAVIKLRIPARRSLDAARRELRAEQPDALVDFNHYYRPDAEPCHGRRCLMRQISGWPIENRASACRPAAPIGLIDTRINIEHPSLAGSRITVLPLFDAEAEPSGAHHGTAVAALLVGKGDVPGLVQGWQLVAVDAFKKGDIATGYDLARAVDMLAGRNVPVINMSLSGPDNAILAASVAEAIKRDIILIAAAGNDGPRAKPAYPAAYPEVVAVTAVDRGKRVYRRAARGAHIDIAAPGVNVWTAASVKGQRPRTGTSFAAPFVTAGVALILADNPGFSREEVEIVLENEADDLGDQGRDEVFGWGLLDISSICSR